MNIGARIRHGVAWVFVGATSRQLLGFLFGIVLARLLAPEDFGALLTIQVFTGMAGFVAGGGMGQALVRAKHVDKKDYDAVFTLQLLIGFLIYAGFFAVSPWFARWYDNPLYSDLLRVYAVTFLFRPFVNLSSNILVRQMRFREQTLAGMVTLIVSNGTSITMAYLHFGVWSLTWGGIAGALASILTLASLARWRPGLSFDFTRSIELARYGMLVSGNDIIYYLRTQAPIFILSRSLGPSSVGLLNKSESLARMPHAFVTGSVYNVLFRAMSAEQDNLDLCRYLFFRSIALVAVYATPLYVGLFWLAEPLVRGVYGEKWIEAVTPLLILSLAWPFWLIDNLAGAVLAAKNWLHQELKIQISALAVIALSILIALPYEIQGVASAMVVTAIFSGCFMFNTALRCLNARWGSAMLALIPAAILNSLLIAALVCFDFLAPTKWLENDLLHVASTALIGGTVYGLALLYLPIPALKTERARWKSRLGLI